MPNPRTVTAVCLLSMGIGTAYAQPVIEEPTAGLELPTSGLSGGRDVFTVVRNPAGILALKSGEFGFAGTGTFAGEGVRVGRGLGLYAGSAVGGGFFPRLGFGASAEFLRPPGQGADTTRLSLATALPFGRLGAIGLSWHHFVDGVVGGTDTVDLGLAARLGSRLAVGVVARDLLSPTVAGQTVSRRYEGEVALRPFVTDRLELAVGGSVGEKKARIGGWARLAFRVLDGVYVRGEYSTREFASVMDDVREHRMSAGLAVSFGGAALATYATGSVLGSGGDPTLRGGTMTAVLRARPEPSILAPGRHIERLEIKGALTERELLRVFSQLRHAAKDSSVVALMIQFKNVAGGWGAVGELRGEIERFRQETKKPVFAHLVSGTTRTYYVASAADHVFVDPAGGVRLDGFAGTSLYYKGLFDLLGVEAQFEKIEEYKSAPETYTHTGPTPAAKKARDELFDSIFETLVADIARGRNLTKRRVRALVNNGPYTAGELQKIPDLVDGVGEPKQIDKWVAKVLGAKFPYGVTQPEREERWATPRIALIVLSGDIVDGKSRSMPFVGRSVAGGETLAQAISQARSDPSIKAIVLRINTPGGSALASELMSREVFKTRGKKPILCSMGDLAASGGYFAAAGCDRIFAGRMTITGSIGIFNGKFDVSGLMSRMGFSWHTYKRGKHSDLTSQYRALTPKERGFLKQKLHYYYGRFIKAVAKGRDMKTKDVDAVGRGRVWTGVQAKKIGLVDELGSAYDALSFAKRRAGYSDDDDVDVVLLPRDDRPLVQRLLGSAIGQSRDASPPVALLGPLAEAVKRVPLSLWVGGDAPQARMPFEIIWADDAGF